MAAHRCRQAGGEPGHGREHLRGGIIVPVVPARAQNGFDPIVPERTLQHADRRLVVEAVELGVGVEAHEIGCIGLAADGLGHGAQRPAVVGGHHDGAAGPVQIDVGAAKDAVRGVDRAGEVRGVGRQDLFAKGGDADLREIILVDARQRVFAPATEVSGVGKHRPH